MDSVTKKPAHEVILRRVEETTDMLMKNYPFESALVGLYCSIILVVGKDLVRILWEMNIPPQDIDGVCLRLLDTAECANVPGLEDWVSLLISLVEELKN
ncbi:MAG: hypothetical protein UT86_C0001G0135 [Candidatus Magasanikbacteria bacterium GW2011_GWC2_40_17]|uniref:Uncharacterized protein n=1 Tax=Candidatus Magasanikbacteria bacterium GW2011_GWA2_42_32 TaxID=1619039 RepID=A0A0G1A8Z2_9BACT|nr:MAG: hypothetical protein UT86_C0001G0135 [Candidatus Magasanikbacteria bacterium GW2011_GWC2_40_17]KKS57495.1 MAG: hypothetical protein UV20_C0001G0135 [Candidatus Magasanikbacteria bacterium GW2011_GWA2_42_32]OGH85211.1 MAG: hypothetical protein A2294_00500 [Candidatus Magasanikbacteria bacterium RIFOXYB2_FULL_38_10]